MIWCASAKSRCEEVPSFEAVTTPSTICVSIPAAATVIATLCTGAGSRCACFGWLYPPGGGGRGGEGGRRPSCSWYKGRGGGAFFGPDEGGNHGGLRFILGVRVQGRPSGLAPPGDLPADLVQARLQELDEG